MGLDTSAAFGQLLIRRKHIYHRAEVSIRQARIVDPDFGVWSGNSTHADSVVVEIVDFVDILSGGYASARDHEPNKCRRNAEDLTVKQFHLVSPKTVALETAPNIDHNSGLHNSPIGLGCIDR